MNGSSSSPYSQTWSTGTGTAGNSKRELTRVTLSVPSRRKPLPKRFGFIPKDRQQELFPIHGERMVAYKRQSPPKPRGGHSRKRRRVSQQAAQEPVPTPVSPTPSISETHPLDYSSSRRVSWESRSIPDFVDRSSSKILCSAFPSIQVGSHEAARPTQGYQCIPSSFHNKTTFPTTLPCSSHLSIMDSQQAVDSFIPHSDQFFYNAPLTPSVTQPSCDSLPYEWLQSSGYSTSHLPIDMGTQNIQGTPSVDNSWWNAASALYGANWERQAFAPYMSGSFVHRNLHNVNQQGLQYYPSSHHSYNPSDDQFNSSGHAHPYQSDSV